ncbi:MAG: hypothetical protein M1826_006041 [Phylliscum demangeonii]|nr:MAG: hypothetical protein M1826_006041 [Phylliscum demangeonii]
MQAGQAPHSGRPGGLPANFQPPANIPNINFSAPVIRLGMTGPSKTTTSTVAGPGGRRDGAGDLGSVGPSRTGLGAHPHHYEQQRQQMRENMGTLVPPSREEIARTIFVGKLNDDVLTDDGLDGILRAVGGLRRWYRATDADGQKCSFGFAEYEDAVSLGTAVEILSDVRLPRKKKAPDEANGVDAEQDADAEKDADADADADADGLDAPKLMVVVDENSLNYLEQYLPRSDQQPAISQARLDGARQALAAVLAELAKPPAPIAPRPAAVQDGEGRAAADGEKAVEGQPEVVNIPLSAEDELSDIPAEMRETVAQEIASFRDRSHRRELERLRREEEIERIEKSRNQNPASYHRLASPPPPQAPSGPAGGANGIPLGPRDRGGFPGAPSGPKAFQGQQIPRDYQKGVAFVNGSGQAVSWHEEEDGGEASDEELERRRKGKREAELEKVYLDQERRWLNRERSRTAAVEREKNREKEEEQHRARERDAVAKRLREWNDDVESSRKVEEYYVDRSMWIRNRATFRQRERHLDELDRAAEARETRKRSEKPEPAPRAGADLDPDHPRSRLDRALDPDTHPDRGPAPAPAPAADAPGREPARFKLSLGAAAQRAHAAANSRRTVAEIEGLLEDEEDGRGTAKRTLIPITLEAGAGAHDGALMTAEERDDAIRQLAQEIPSAKDGLWAWPVAWDLVDEAVTAEKLRPFVEKKIVEYLGVQEQMLVEVVEEHLRKRGPPQELVERLEGALDEEAEALVKKLWRMMIFFSESEKRGLSA